MISLQQQLEKRTNSREVNMKQQSQMAEEPNNLFYYNQNNDFQTFSDHESDHNVLLTKCLFFFKVKEKQIENRQKYKHNISDLYHKTIQPEVDNEQISSNQVMSEIKDSLKQQNSFMNNGMEQQIQPIYKTEFKAKNEEEVPICKIQPLSKIQYPASKMQQQDEEIDEVISISQNSVFQIKQQLNFSKQQMKNIIDISDDQNDHIQYNNRCRKLKASHKIKHNGKYYSRRSKQKQKKKNEQKVKYKHHIKNMKIFSFNKKTARQFGQSIRKQVQKISLDSQNYKSKFENRLKAKQEQLKRIFQSQAKSQSDSQNQNDQKSENQDDQQLPSSSSLSQKDMQSNQSSFAPSFKLTSIYKAQCRSSYRIKHNSFQQQQQLYIKYLVNQMYKKQEVISKPRQYGQKWNQFEDQLLRKSIYYMNSIEILKKYKGSEAIILRARKLGLNIPNQIFRIFTTITNDD